MTLISSNAGAFNYERAWKQVDKDMAQDLPESAADKVSGIFDMAARDHDSKQMLKSAVYMSQIESMLVGDNLTSSIDLFNGLLPKLGQKEYKAICHAFLAKSYLQYWNRNRWRMQRNVPQDKASVPLEKWTAAQICDTVMEHLRQSVDMAGEARSQWFEDFFPGGNKEGMRLRPALADLLLDNAVTEISGQRLNRAQRKFLEDRRLYGTAQEFAEATRGISSDDPDLWSLYILNRMTVRNFVSKPDARSTVDSRRMDVLGQMLDDSNTDWTETDSIWVDGMARLAESYGKKVKFAAVFLSDAARRIMDCRYTMNDEQEIRNMSLARDLCRRAMKLWPKSEGAFNCMGILADIEGKDVNLTLPGDLMAGSSNIAMFGYRNTGTVYFRAIEVAGELKDMNVPSVLDQLARCNIASEWKNVMGSPSDYVDHVGLSRIPPLMQGFYYIVASTGPNFGAKDNIAYAFCQCRALEFVPMETEKGNIDGYFINAATGKPVPDVKYTLWQLDYRGNQTKIATYGYGESDGHVLIQGLADASYSFEMSRGSDIGNSPARVWYVRDMPRQGAVRLYTDRHSYRPGDSIRFAALFYDKDGFKGGSVKAGAPVTVELYDASSRKIGSTALVTDSMGMVMDAFKVPSGSMPGSFRLRAMAGQEGDQASCSNTVNVENFNQPKFVIELDAFDELRRFDSPITVSGKVVTETGLPVSGAQVQWNANMDGSLVDIFKLRNSNGSIHLAGGQTMTGSDGSFRLSFTVREDMTYADGSAVSVSLPLQVTDLNGETRTLETNMLIGPGSRTLNPKFTEGGIIGADGEVIPVALTDNGKNVKGSVRATVIPMENRKGIRLDRNGIFPSGLNDRKLGELTASAVKQGLAEHFTSYCLDFSHPQAGTPVLDETVETGREPGVVRLQLKESGMYRTVLASDLAREYSRDSYYVLEDDREYVPQGTLLWAVRESSDVRVGDTAVIRLGNCWPGSAILYSVIGRMGMESRGTLVSQGKQMKLEIPVTEGLEGGFTVYLYCMMDNMAENRTLHFTVQYASHSLKGYAVIGDDNMKPGDAVDWKLKLENPDGSPARARVLVGMYDSALDALGTNRWNLQPWNGVYPTVGSSGTYRYSQQYNPAWYSQAKVKSYTGKVALTGVLLDPLQNIQIGTRAVRMMGSSAVTATVAKVQMVNDSSPVSESLMMSEPETAVMQQEGSVEGILENADNLRTDMDPTGLFLSLDTDSEGVASIQFDAPELLTRWHVQAIAWTDSLSVGQISFDRTTRKDIMIEPAAPRFVRQGDRLEFTFKILNSTESGMDVKAGISLADAMTGKAVKALAGGASASNTVVHVPAMGSAVAAFTVNVPSGSLQMMDYTLTATNGKYSDGLKQTIPVLSTRTQVTESISLFNNGNETRSFRFDALARQLSTQAAGERVVLEYSSTPIWYAVQCLPTLIKADDPSSLRLAHSITGAASALEIMKRNPEIRAKVQEWAALPAGELQSRLERNEDISGVLAAETPWYTQSENEKDRLRSLGRALEESDLKAQLTLALDRLYAMHLDGEGWPWMEGMGPDVHITLSILDQLGRLLENGALERDRKMENAVSDALMWLDATFASKYEAKEKPVSVGSLELSYLLVIQRFDGLSYLGRRNDVHKFYMNLAQKQDTRELSLMERAQLVLVLAGTDAARAAHVVETMLERSVLEDEMGRYWRDNKSGYRWQDAPIEAQSLAIEALLVTGHEREAGECARWLLKQRQTGDWGTSPATAQAVVALLAAAGGEIVTSPDITVSMGRNSYRTQDCSDMDGYMKVVIPGRASAGMANMKVDSKSDAVSWGAVYYQYTDELENVTGSANGITLERTLWRVVSNADGDLLQETSPSVPLEVGDRIRVCLKVKVGRAMEYVRIRDMWAAGFEPEQTRAGWRGGSLFARGCYMAPGNSCTDIYFDRLEEGSFEVEYDMFIQKPGTFQTGRATVQCLYSPDMNAATAPLKLSVK